MDKKFRISLLEKDLDTLQTTSDTVKKALDFILHRVTINMRVEKVEIIIKNIGSDGSIYLSDDGS